jgi:glycosyltransferase involved in cell wall biosynthesis
MSASMLPAEFGINLVANLSANAGMGVTSRNMARALRRHGVPLAIADLGYPWGGRHPVDDFAPCMAATWDELRHPVNLYVLPIGVLQGLSRAYPWLTVPGRMHVMSLWWEASTLPPAWVEPLGRYDAVLAGSDFLAGVAAGALTLTPVIGMKQPLELPAGIAADRPRFGLPADAVVFAASLDPNSDHVRKNPVGLVHAFQMAFPAGERSACLAIRLNNVDTEAGRATREAVREAAGNDGRVELLAGPMTYGEVLSFYASSDAYVSLHRGEGLGLGLMEAMALGKPVVATGWSGNMSFMDHSCGCPVRYRLVPVSGAWSFYRPGFIGPDARWADPMIDDAASWLRRLHDDAPLRHRLGAAAKARFAAY